MKKFNVDPIKEAHSHTITKTSYSNNPNSRSCLSYPPAPDWPREPTWPDDRLYPNTSPSFNGHNLIITTNYNRQPYSQGTCPSNHSCIAQTVRSISNYRGNIPGTRGTRRTWYKSSCIDNP